MDKIRVDALKVNAGHYANITILGVCKALQGTSASILIGVSIYGFASINILAGWLAVGAFLACCATFAVGKPMRWPMLLPWMTSPRMS